MNQSNPNNNTTAQLVTLDSLIAPTNLSPDAEAAILKDLVANPRDPINLVRAKKVAAEQLGLSISDLEKVYKAALSQANTATVEKHESGTGILFADVQPWPEPVNGSEVLDDVLAALQKHVIADKETLHAASLWVCMTWLVEHATVLPLAMITAPEPGCGKSTLLTTMAKMSFKPLQASNTTTAAMFRAIEAIRPTLFIDEADTHLNNDEGMRGIINSGHTRDSAYVMRTVGEDFETKTFSTWCAKALCGIGSLPETIESRSIILKLRRKMPHEKAGNLRHSDPAVFDVIKQKLARWSADNGKAFGKLHPVMDGLSNRDADNYEPLISIAMLAGGDWENRITKAALILTHSDNDNRSIGTKLLDACRTAFEVLKTDKISTAKLIAEISNDDESPFAAFTRGQPIRPDQLSKLLRKYDIAPKTIRFSNSDSTKRGYDKRQFEEAFAAYLDGSPDLAHTTTQTPKYEALCVSGSGLRVKQQHTPETAKPVPALACVVVSADSPQPLVENVVAEKSAQEEWDEYERLLRE